MAGNRVGSTWMSLSDQPGCSLREETRTDGQRRHDLHVCAAGPEAAPTRPTETPRPPSPQHLLHLPAAVSFNAEEQHLL